MKGASGAIHKTADAVFFHLAGTIVTQRQLPTLALFGDLKIKAPRSHDLRRINLTKGRSHFERVWIQLFDIGFNGREGVFVNQIRFVQNDDVGKFDLFGQKIGHRSRVVLGSRLFQTLQVLAHSQVFHKVGRIDHGDHRVEFSNFRQRCTITDCERKCVRHRRRFRNSGRFDQQIIETPLFG